MLCIPRHIIADFKARLKSGEITPEKLLDMTSEQRHELFSKTLGISNAKDVNALFEQKMLLKSQQEGIVKWAQEVVGMKPEVKRDILARVAKMDKLLTPENQDAFLEDLVAHKLGVTVTMEEAGNIASLAKAAVELEKKAPVTKNIFEETPEQREIRMQSGRARVAFQDYVSGLKEKAKSKTLKEWVMPKNWGEGLVNVGGMAKSLKASFDNSVIGRQGIKTLFTEPDIWAKNSARSFKDWADALKGVDVMDEVRADILSRPNSRNGLYRREGLAVGVKEETYPSSFWEKTPVLGRIFKASESAFTAWQYRTRADVFDRLVDVADKTGADIAGIGKFVNSLTGRGSIGKLEPSADTLNKVFFAPRFVKANLDTLTGHRFSKDMSPFARKQAAISTAKIVVGMATVLAISRALNKDSVELDPRSSDFGKIKVGNTRFDISGGMGSLVTVAARIVPGIWGQASSKSSVTGIVSPLNSGKYGSQSVLDVLLNFTGGKLSPMAGIFRDVAKGKDFQGNKVTVQGEAVNLFAPLPITNAIELYTSPGAAPMIAGLIADGLGIGVNTYSKSVDWSTAQGKELLQFKAKAGDNKFKEANALFNTRLNERMNAILSNDKFKALSDDEKHAVLTKEQDKIKEKVFREYNFRYKQERKPRLPRI